MQRMHLVIGTAEDKMKPVKVLGTGCTKCKMLVEIVKQSAERTGVAIDLEKIKDMAKIIGWLQ
jgi:hypothetical protein